MKDVKYNISDITNQLGSKIAKLEQELAIERASRLATIKYAEELEQKIQELEGKTTTDNDK